MKLLKVAFEIQISLQKINKDNKMDIPRAPQQPNNHDIPPHIPTASKKINNTIPPHNVVNNFYQKKRSIFLTGCLWISSFFAVLMIALIIGVIFVAKSVSSLDTQDGEFSFSSAKNAKNSSKPKIAILDISGVMLDKSQGGFGGNGNIASADKIVKQIKAIQKDLTIKAVVLKINSPGGAVTAADSIYQSLLELKRKRQIPIVSSFQSLAASGGYYIAMSSDYIFTNRMGITGSIGVIMSGYKYQKLLQKIGVEAEVYKSGPMKDLLSPTRPTTPEEKEIVQNLVNVIYQDFVSIVDKGRPKLTLKELSNTELTDGRIFLGTQAVKNGLADALGVTDDAIAYAAAKASLKEGEYSVFTMKEKFSLAQFFGAEMKKSQKINISVGNNNLTSDVSLDPNIPYLLPPNYKK